MSGSNSGNKQKRALSLDALRGLAILLMVLSSKIPWGVLPYWMYHAQIPPPSHEFNPNLPGLTWVDLVFPFFLFAMGAAIPLALSKKIDRGISYSKIFSSIVKRGLFLAGFAFYIMHVNPYAYDYNPDLKRWIIALVGFVFVFPVLARLPKDWNNQTKLIVRGTGWTGALLLMIFIHFPDGSGFSVDRSDHIILVLSNVVVFTSIAWIITRDNLMFRLGILGILVALRLSSSCTGLIHSVYHTSFMSWLFQFEFLEYLLITLLGTVIGDMILAWMNNDISENRDEHEGWSKKRYIALELLMLLISVEVVIGMSERFVLPSFVFTVVLCVIGWMLIRYPHNDMERLIKNIFRWGVYWLILGFFLEPFEGGIKKEPATLSYFFVAGGLAVFMFLAFIIVVDVFKKKKSFGVLIESGQNPMIAYVAMNNFVIPILVLTKIDAFMHYITPYPWLGAIYGAIITYMVALTAAVFTKKKIFLRT